MPSDAPANIAYLGLNQTVEYLFSNFDFSYVVLKNMVKCKDMLQKFSFTVPHGTKISWSQKQVMQYEM